MVRYFFDGRCPSYRFVKRDYLVTPLRGVTFSLALCAISNMTDQGPSLKLFVITTKAQQPLFNPNTIV
jgi:hypothetical protein